MRKILCMILTLLIGSCSILTVVHANNENTNNLIRNKTGQENNITSQGNVTDLQTQQEELQTQIQEASGELEGVQEELSENLQQVQKLDEKIATAEEEIAGIGTQIDELQSSINVISEELEVAKENYEKQKETLETRLVAIYEAGETVYLDVLLQSKNIAEFLSNCFLVTELVSYDANLLEEMQEKKQEIEEKKETLDKKQGNLATIKQSKTKTAKILENTKQMRENYITKLTDQEKEVQAKIDEYIARFAEINAEILKLAMNGIDTVYIGGELAWPVPGYTRISSKYGMRTHPITGVYKLHSGVDIGAPMGANFIAANDGIVTKAGYNSAYGNMVIIDHGGGVSTLYAHGSEIVVQVGQTVKRGDVILKVGSTGYSTGPHAHFEVRLNGVVTDPMPYITTGMVPTTQNQNTNASTNQTNHNTTEQTTTEQAQNTSQ